MRNGNLIAVALIGGLLWGAPGAADAQMASDDGAAEPELVDVTETTCGELAEASELDRAFSLMFYYGYLAGRENAATIDGSAVTGHLERVRDFCNANPDETVVDAFVSALRDGD